MTEYNPSNATVDQVNEYLAKADDTERVRVLAAEAAGKARKGILSPDDGSDPEVDATHPLQPTTTKAATFQDAAKTADFAPEGPLKGLTLAEVVAGPAPDNRPGLPEHDTDDQEN